MAWKLLLFLSYRMGIPLAERAILNSVRGRGDSPTPSSSLFGKGELGFKVTSRFIAIGNDSQIFGQWGFRQVF